MILGTGNDSNVNVSVINKIIASEFRFYLTGSRFFDPDLKITGSDDVDFFVMESVQVELFLKSLGLKNIGGRYRGHGVDVKLVKDDDGERTVTSLVCGLFEHQFLNYREMKNADLLGKLFDMIRVRLVIASDLPNQNRGGKIDFPNQIKAF